MKISTGKYFLKPLYPLNSYVICLHLVPKRWLMSTVPLVYKWQGLRKASKSLPIDHERIGLSWRKIPGICFRVCLPLIYTLPVFLIKTVRGGKKEKTQQVNTLIFLLVVCTFLAKQLRLDPWFDCNRTVPLG